MIIILEGENKTGKTTLANYIKENFDFDYIKCSQPKGNPFDEYNNILDNIKEHTIIDRFHWGELVYGPIYRGKSGISESQFNELEKKIEDLGAIIIYCYDNANNIKKRFIEEKEEFATTNNIEKVLKLYNEVYKISILNKYKHKIKGQMDLILNKKINKIIKKNLICLNQTI